MAFFAMSQRPHDPEPVSTDTGFVDAGAGSESGTGWSNESNITAEDGSVASTATIDTQNGETEELRSSDYGFSLPAGATIDGIEARIKAKQNSADFDYDQVILRWNSTTQGTSQESGEALQDNLTFNTFGGSANTWGASPTKDDVERSDFGLQVRFQKGFSGSGTVDVDCVQVKIYYTYTP